MPDPEVKKLEPGDKILVQADSLRSAMYLVKKIDGTPPQAELELINRAHWADKTIIVSEGKPQWLGVDASAAFSGYESAPRSSWLSMQNGQLNVAYTREANIKIARARDNFYPQKKWDLNELITVDSHASEVARLSASDIVPSALRELEKQNNAAADTLKRDGFKARDTGYDGRHVSSTNSQMLRGFQQTYDGYLTPSQHSKINRASSLLGHMGMIDYYLRAAGDYDDPLQIESGLKKAADYSMDTLKANGEVLFSAGFADDYTGNNVIGGHHVVGRIKKLETGGYSYTVYNAGYGAQPVKGTDLVYTTQEYKLNISSEEDLKKFLQLNLEKHLIYKNADLPMLSQELSKSSLGDIRKLILKQVREFKGGLAEVKAYEKYLKQYYDHENPLRRDVGNPQTKGNCTQESTESYLRDLLGKDQQGQDMMSAYRQFIAGRNEAIIGDFSPTRPDLANNKLTPAIVSEFKSKLLATGKTDILNAVFNLNVKTDVELATRISNALETEDMRDVYRSFNTQLEVVKNYETNLMPQVKPLQTGMSPDPAPPVSGLSQEFNARSNDSGSASTWRQKFNERALAATFSTPLPGNALKVGNLEFNPLTDKGAGELENWRNYTNGRSTPSGSLFTKVANNEAASTGIGTIEKVAKPLSKANIALSVLGFVQFADDISLATGLEFSNPVTGGKYGNDAVTQSFDQMGLSKNSPWRSGHNRDLQNNAFASTLGVVPLGVTQAASGFIDGARYFVNDRGVQILANDIGRAYELKEPQEVRLKALDDFLVSGLSTTFFKWEKDRPNVSANLDYLLQTGKIHPGNIIELTDKYLHHLKRNPEDFKLLIEKEGFTTRFPSVMSKSDAEKAFSIVAPNYKQHAQEISTLRQIMDRPDLSLSDVRNTISEYASKNLTFDQFRQKLGEVLTSGLTDNLSKAWGAAGYLADKVGEIFSKPLESSWLKAKYNITHPLDIINSFFADTPPGLPEPKPDLPYIFDVSAAQSRQMTMEELQAWQQFRDHVASGGDETNASPEVKKLIENLMLPAYRDNQLVYDTIIAQNMSTPPVTQSQLITMEKQAAENIKALAALKKDKAYGQFLKENDKDHPYTGLLRNGRATVNGQAYTLIQRTDEPLLLNDGGAGKGYVQLVETPAGELLQVVPPGIGMLRSAQHSPVSDNLYWQLFNSPENRKWLEEQKQKPAVPASDQNPSASKRPNAWTRP